MDTLDVKKDLNAEFGSETDNYLIVFVQTAKTESKTRVYETIWSQKLPKKAKIFSRKIILERVTLTCQGTLISKEKRPEHGKTTKWSANQTVQSDCFELTVGPVF